MRKLVLYTLLASKSELLCDIHQRMFSALPTSAARLDSMGLGSSTLAGEPPR